MRMWLDDMRPAPEGWTWVKTVKEAKALLLAGGVFDASLDHDLGACETGYDLVLWMEETGVLPETCSVHSRNPVGKSRMLAGLRSAYNRWT